MCQALRELMKDEIARDVQQGVITGTVNVYRDEMGLDDQTILGRIVSKFNLSEEQARAYIVPQGT